MLAITYVFIILQTLGLVTQSYQQCYEVDSPENGQIKIDRYFSSYRVYCNPGYIRHGNSVIHCRNGQWDSSPPTCVENDRVCEELPPLENGIIQCDEGPLYAGKACHFQCNSGYELQGVTMKRCLFQNYQWSGPSPKCVPITSTFCELPPPLEHGTVVGCSSEKLPRVYEKCSFRCNDGYSLIGPISLTCTSSGKYLDERRKENFPKCVVDLCSNHTCEQICRIEKGRPQCRCNKGFLLNKEDQRTCNKNYGKPVHSAKPEYPRNPCRTNNGGCDQLCNLSREWKVFCSCRKGFRPDSTDPKKCIRNTPENIPAPPPRATCDVDNGGCEHHCSYSRGFVYCYCSDGYELHSDGKHCIENPPAPPPRVTCQEDNGGCQDYCSDRRGSVECYCSRGYQLDPDGKKCNDIDECSSEFLNNCQHTCYNTDGSFTCSCKPGYVLVDGHKCEGCGKRSYWNVDGCVECPAFSGTNSEGKTSIKDCVCDPGFVGNPGEGIACEDINECHINNFGCSDTCFNIPGNAYCSCPVGFELDKDNKTCIDMDECSIKNGGCEGTCHNLHGTFRCSCPEGYVPSNKDLYTCEDVNECLDNNGGCEQNCVNHRGGYYCSCEAGYRLDSGQKNCTDIQCPALQVPPFSNRICKKDGVKLPEIETYPIGTTCKFPCSKGYKDSKGSRNMECKEDGTWSGMLPECRVQSCDALSVPENGAVHPASCSRKGNKVKQRCTFTCNSGYKLKGKSIFTCRNNKTWSNEEIPFCELEEIQPVIQCPQDVIATLMRGKNTHNVTLQAPFTNTGDYTVVPDWVSTGVTIEFPVGSTKVTFIANSPNSNKTARCATTVNIIDKEPPVFEFCPDPIQIEGVGADGELVNWQQPVVTDNVEVDSLFSVSESNTTHTPGTYTVEYIARDTSGNIATCSFNIRITRANCSDLADPAHGQANCMDWLTGKLCQPQCDIGYMLDPRDYPYYTCEDSGVWEPSDVISECLRFTPATSSTCEDGFELIIEDESSAEVCLECPSNKAWSATTKKCE